ncbi:type 1 glutamine amidotransferase [Starkeya sp. ORNL1]|uniref:type 1 glutamine amidotransferase n=1 Tax=Starkeya sp. ORNL1 TaxID=2709380 RepID=UPI001462CF33|nr:type 1 glutamine amidotransferase [Starkeya sp. ORNL1]QJP16817.1 type 1 glutamine amidotransferase [Starkeya sp. ORNL1]
MLIVDSAPSTTRAELIAHGGLPHGEIYTKALRSQSGGIATEIEFLTLAAGDGDFLPPGLVLSDLDGVAWTGSPFSAYDDQPIVLHQMAFARAAFESGVPCFGSCWGLQVMSAALGGRVRRHLKGLEFGVGRRITLNAAGRAHGMFQGKPDAFDVLCIHQDEVCTLPSGARLLAGNDHSAIQAAEIEENGRSFWGVQYHPEYDLRQMAALLRRAARHLIADGLIHSIGEVEQMVADYLAVSEDAAREDLIHRHELSREVIEPSLHGLELANWLRVKVVPRAAARANVS